MILESVMLIIKNAGSALLDWIPKIRALRNKDIPNKTIVVVSDDSGYRNFWHVGSQNGKPILQVDCSFMVTNVTDRPVALAKALLKGIKGSQEFAQLSVKDLYSKYHGSYDIPSRARTSVSVHFIISPLKVPKSGKPIKLKVGIIDQFGNEYWIKNVVFRSS